MRVCLCVCLCGATCAHTCFRTGWIYLSPYLRTGLFCALNCTIFWFLVRLIASRQPFESASSLFKYCSALVFVLCRVCCLISLKPSFFRCEIGRILCLVPSSLESRAQVLKPYLRRTNLEPGGYREKGSGARKDGKTWRGVLLRQPRLTGRSAEVFVTESVIRSHTSEPFVEGNSRGIYSLTYFMSPAYLGLRHWQQILPNFWVESSSPLLTTQKPRANGLPHGMLILVWKWEEFREDYAQVGGAEQGQQRRGRRGVWATPLEKSR